MRVRRPTSLATPVVGNGKLVGVVGIGDVVTERLDQQAREFDTLRDHVAGWG